MPETLHLSTEIKNTSTVGPFNLVNAINVLKKEEKKGKQKLQQKQFPILVINSSKKIN